MIHVHVLVPSHRDILMFACDEDYMTDSFMEQVGAVLHEKFEGSRDRWLCHVEKRRLLSHNQTLRENGLTDGSNLVVV